LRPAARALQSAGGAVVYHRESGQQAGHLLPPLLAPNDDEMKQILLKESEDRKDKNRRFKEYQGMKEKEADRSTIESESVRATEEDFEGITQGSAPALDAIAEEDLPSAEENGSEVEVQKEEEGEVNRQAGGEVQQAVKSETFEWTQTEQFKADLTPSRATSRE
jgi:hypothetical protein